MKPSSRARGWALITLYAWDMRGGQVDDALDMLHSLTRELNVGAHNRAYAEVLVRLVSGNQRRIERVLDQALENWRLDRLSAIDRNLLRLGAAELLYVDELDPRRAIRGWADLAGKYGTYESPRFVQGVLHAVLRQSEQRAPMAAG